MLRNRSISLALVSALFWIFLSSPALAAEPPWLEIHSAHFTVITDAGEKKGREVALRFEQMRSVFGILLSKTRLNQSVPLTILAFKNDRSYYQLAPLIHVPGEPEPRANNRPGFFLPGDDQDFIVLNLFENEPWRAVAHDFAVMMLSYNYPPAQGWFDEGLAEYFSTIHLDNKQVEIGGDPELISTLAEDMVGNQTVTNPPKSLTELLGAQVWLPLPDLFTLKHDPSTLNKGEHHVMFYAQSWIVMHYLIHEKKLPETGAYFGLVLNQHVAVEDAIQKAYGMTSAQMEQAVKDYFKSQTSLFLAVDAARQTTTTLDDAGSVSVGPAQPFRFPTPVGPDDSTMSAKPLPEDDERALYAEVEIRIPERREIGLQQLQALANAPTLADKKLEGKNEVKKKEKHYGSGEEADVLPPTVIGNALAHRILAWDHIEHSEFGDAANELNNAFALTPQDMWLRYYSAVLKYRIAQSRHTDTLGLPNMMLDLKGVLDWYPELAAAYDLLALARNEGGSTPAAMEAERAAIGLSPRNEMYTYHLAQIYVASKKYEASQVLIDRLKASNNPQIVALARELQDHSLAERKYGIPLGATSLPQPKLAPQKSPFDVLEEDAAKRAAAEKIAQSTGPHDTRPTRFLRGRLVAVDCSQAPAAVLTVENEGAVLKLRAADYRSMLLIGADSFSCDWKDRQVTANYKLGGAASGIAANGDLVSLEVR